MTFGVARHAESQREGLSRSGAAVALLARHLAHIGIEEPCAMRARFLAFRRVRGREVAVRQTLLENRLRHSTVQRQPLRLFVFFVPSEIEPAQAFENGSERLLSIALDIGVVDS